MDFRKNVRRTFNQRLKWFTKYILHRQVFPLAICLEVFFKRNNSVFFIPYNGFQFTKASKVCLNTSPDNLLHFTLITLSNIYLFRYILVIKKSCSSEESTCFLTPMADDDRHSLMLAFKINVINQKIYSARREKTVHT